MRMSVESRLPPPESGVEADLRFVSFHGASSARPRPRCVQAASPRADGQEPLSPADAFAEWVLRQAGLDERAYRRRVFARRVPACLRALKVDSLDAARLRLDRHRELLPLALDNLLIGVSGFFRDLQVFDDLWRTVVPHLASLRRPPRIWSAACSSGGELYSVAILLDEAGLLAGAHLLGTDCRDGAIAAARAGTFDSTAIQSLPADRIARSFESQGSDRMRVVPRLLSSCSWKTADLVRAGEPGPWDVVLWRNSAIYLEPAVASRVYRSMTAVLGARGFLVTGKAERPPGHLGYTQVGKCLFQRAGGAGS